MVLSLSPVPFLLWVKEVNKREEVAQKNSCGKEKRDRRVHKSIVGEPSGRYESSYDKFFTATTKKLVLRYFLYHGKFESHVKWDFPHCYTVRIIKIGELPFEHKLREQPRTWVVFNFPDWETSWKKNNSCCSFSKFYCPESKGVIFLYNSVNVRTLD